MSKNYVNNKDLLEYIINRKSENAKRLANDQEPLPLDNFIGGVILEIAKRLAFRPNFINYTYREEMIGDAVENGLRIIDNFDPALSNNPFGYLTQVIWNAFIRRIQIEKKQQKIKGRIISEIPLEDLFNIQEHDEDGIQYSHHIMDFLRENNFGGDDSFAHPPVEAPPIVLKGVEKFFE